MAQYNENTINMESVPVPEKMETVVENTEMEFDQDTILTLINSVDEDGNCPCFMLASLELYKDVTNDMMLTDVPEENKTIVDDMQIEDCSVDLYTMDGELVNAVFTFNSDRNAYLQELKRLLDRYRLMQDEIASNPDANDRIAVLSLAFLPKALNGKGLMQLSFPVSYFRTLDDAGLNVCMHTLFHMNNIQFMKVDIDEETEAEMTADILREMEGGTGGALFDEE